MMQGKTGTPVRYEIRHTPFLIGAPRTQELFPRATPPSGQIPTIRPASRRAMDLRIVLTGTPNRRTFKSIERAKQRGNGAVLEKLNPCNPIDRPRYQSADQKWIQMTDMAARHDERALAAGNFRADRADAHGAAKDEAPANMTHPIQPTHRVDCLFKGFGERG